MKKLIVCQFIQQTHAEITGQALQRDSFAVSELCQFFIHLQGQHNLNVMDGDVDEAVGTQYASLSAFGWAISSVCEGALLGVAKIPVLEPAGRLLGAAVGAFTSSLVGALGRTDNVDPQNSVQPQHGGVVLAV